MAKITGNAGLLGIRLATTHNTAVSAFRNMAFDSLEYNDNPETLEFSTKGQNLVMKNGVQFGIKKPTLRLTYKLKYGGQGQALIAGFFGTQTTPAELTGGQGDYNSKFYFNSTRKFYTIAVQDSSATSIEWASCYPVNIDISSTIGQPVTVSIDFVTTPRTNTPSNNTFANLASTTETTTSDYCVFMTNSYILLDARGDGNWDVNANKQACIGFNQSYSRPMEIMPEAYAVSTYSAPISTGLFGAITTINFNGFDDHTFHTLYSAETEQELGIAVIGSTIGSGTEQTFGMVSGKVKINQDLSANISSDGFNAGSVTFEHLYSATTQTSGYTMPSIILTSKDTTAYI
jgi:hypothetical protein